MYNIIPHPDDFYTLKYNGKFEGKVQGLGNLQALINLVGDREKRRKPIFITRGNTEIGIYTNPQGVVSIHVAENSEQNRTVLVAQYHSELPFCSYCGAVRQVKVNSVEEEELLSVTCPYGCEENGSYMPFRRDKC